MSTILDKIVSAHHVASEAQIESLALEAYKAGTIVQRIDGIYLRVLVAGCQAELGPVRRGRAPNAEAQLAVIERIHEKFYAAVLRGVTTSDVAAEEGLETAERNRRTLERSRRSTFARTAKSTLVSFARNGGDIRGLKPDNVTKAELRATLPPGASQETVTPIVRAQRTLVAEITKQAKDDPGGARAELERVMDELQAVLDSLDDGHTGTTTTVAQRAHARTRAGQPVMLHRGA